ncbi:unnamed protein product [Owenia fusiformis]|uniref:HIRAN domain-containing protein n=1 Tax=Owenia fusiformis TaxID=6347 RepID=A0A8S4QBD6_OWEFU|nr:unnamed protein product [Owenia fusiformis]
MSSLMPLHCCSVNCQRTKLILNFLCSVMTTYLFQIGMIDINDLPIGCNCLRSTPNAIRLVVCVPAQTRCAMHFTQKMASEHEKTFHFESTIRGYHEYKDTCDIKIGESVYCCIDEDNAYDKNATFVKKNDKIVGHVPRENANIFKFFLKRGGTISGKIVGKRLNKGKGLEIPVVYVLKGRAADINKLESLLKSTQ